MEKWENIAKIGEHIGNPLGTPREYSANTLGSWDESEVLIWRTCWGTHCELREHIGNPLGT